MSKQENSFNPMGTIEKNVISTVRTETEKFKNDSKIKEFEKASAEFKSLIEKGLVKERGYNLLSVENAHLKGANFNVNS